MSLDKYRAKRSFDKTPEPPPAPGKSEGTRFYIQRHLATRLHYDLRLEAAGVLKSWAVPKGPTLDPEEKRLAILVEDHPIDYGVFEGTIPSGNYGAGSVTVWDHGTYDLIGEESFEEQLGRGDLKFRLHGDKLVGAFALARIRKSNLTSEAKSNEWLLIKKKDFAAHPGWDAEDHLSIVFSANLDPSLLPGAVRCNMPAEISPMLATACAVLPEGPEWLFELKWDGVRVHCYIDKAKLKLISRTGKRMEGQYPELSAVREQIACGEVILDGEIGALTPEGRPSFSLLQARIGVNSVDATRLARIQPVHFFVFDLLYFNGYDLRGVPLSERKRILQSIVHPGGIVRYSEHFIGKGQRLLQFARANDMEGIVAKRADSCYASKRSLDWLKLKVVMQQDFVIGGYTAGGRDYFGSLALGYYEGSNLLFAGNVGSGFGQELLKTIYELLQPLSSEASKAAPCPFTNRPVIAGETTWVTPTLICAVRFQSWTRDCRLRAPVFLGLREDVNAVDCVRETAAKVEAATKIPGRTKLLSPKDAEAALSIDGHRLKFTNLNKVFYRQESYTKRDVINYYDAVSDLILPHLKDRPLSLKRYPDGIEGKFFFQKEAAESFPSWLRIEPIFSEHNQAPIHFVIANDRASLLYLANLGCIDQNPWMSCMHTLDNPDFVLLDLDPSDCAYDRIVEAAQLIHRKLELLALEGYPKTTGGDGMHIYIPIEPEYTYEQVRRFAEIIARLVAHERPDLFTTPRSVSRREKGKVYFDFLQISSGKTISAPYVLRAYPGAPVSTPLAWREVVKGLSPNQFHMGNAVERFLGTGDLFAPVLKNRQRLEGALGKLGSLLR